MLIGLRHVTFVNDKGLPRFRITRWRRTFKNKVATCALVAVTRHTVNVQTPVRQRTIGGVARFEETHDRTVRRVLAARFVERGDVLIVLRRNLDNVRVSPIKAIVGSHCIVVRTKGTARFGIITLE